MKKKTIKLYNRDNSNVFLEFVKGSTWQLKGDYSYIRMGKTNEDTLFVDPSGGPFLSEGVTINDKTIKWVENVPPYGIFITFE